MVSACILTAKRREEMRIWHVLIIIIIIVEAVHSYRDSVGHLLDVGPARIFVVDIRHRRQPRNRNRETNPESAHGLSHKTSSWRRAIKLKPLPGNGLSTSKNMMDI